MIWHQELICPSQTCRGQRRVFPPGELIDSGRREQRTCPHCATTVRVPAFYRTRVPRPTHYYDPDEARLVGDDHGLA